MSLSKLSFAIFLSYASVARCDSTLPVSGLFFYETFDEGDPFSSGKWIKTKVEKYSDQPVLIKPANSPAKGFEHDNGLQLSKDMKYYGLSTKFSEPLTLKDQKEIVVQYELKLEESLSCGGAYIKLPRATDTLDLELLDNDTPYTIMFGPDKCGTSNNKVHFIFQHQNPLNSAWEEKHFKDTPPIKTDKKTHLYTLVVKSDNSFEIYIDKMSVKKGNLLTDMEPPVNPPKEIDDPEDKKPDDWVDEAKVDDPDATKPEDWDEEQPMKITDPKAVKPADWLDDAPADIPDPTASRPEDWDDEEVTLILSNECNGIILVAPPVSNRLISTNKSFNEIKRLSLTHITHT